VEMLALTGFCVAKANRFTSRLHLQAADKDDVLQEAFLAVLVALPFYDPERGPWEPFFGQVIGRKLKYWHHRRRLVRYGYAQRWRRHPRVRSLEWDTPDPAWDEDESGDSFAQLHSLVHLVPLLADPDDRTLMIHLLAGETLADIARLTNRSRQAVHQRWQRLQRRLRQLFDP
jgi:RNA polymerase sigma factor (sigma-70 family)